MALRVGIRALYRSCAFVSGQAHAAAKGVSAGASVTMGIFTVPSRLYSNAATSQLVKQINTELKLEQKPMQLQPSGFTSFELTADGALATLTRQHDQESIKIQMDANSAIEASSDEAEFDGEGEEEEAEPVFVPTFTVTVTKPSGDSMVFDCSFAEYGNYGEMGNAWESLQINSISIVPEGVTDVETVYCADTANMSDELYSLFVEYLKERKVDDTFANEILDFYRTFEHHCYIKNFLDSVKNFVST